MTYLESAIIGYWRQGATVQEICDITEHDDWVVMWMITNYFKYNENNKLW